MSGKHADYGQARPMEFYQPMARDATRSERERMHNDPTYDYNHPRPRRRRLWVGVVVLVTVCIATALLATAR